MYVTVCVYHYKTKSIDDDDSGGFLYCQTERTDERKKKERKEEFDRQRQTSHIKGRFYIVSNYYLKRYK
jgi:hypothetical protein